MDKQSLFFTAVVAIVATAFMLIATQFLAKKLKIKMEIEGKTSISFTIWLTTLIISFFLFLKVALKLVENTIELIIFSWTIKDTFISVMQKLIIYTGFTFAFTFLSYFIAHNLLKLLLGNRIDSNESESENIGYFIVKGVLLIFLTLSLTSVFEHFLQWFMPAVETPFYR